MANAIVATQAPGAKPVKASGIGTRKEALAGYAFISVPMLFFLVLNIGAILYAAYISVWKWNIRLGPTQFIGLQNYQNALTDPTFQVAIKNTIYYTILWVPLTMAIGLFLAVIVNQKIRGLTFFRAAFYFPAIASSAAITTLWIFLAAPDGFFNEVRGALGINPLFHLFGYVDNQNWIGNQGTAMQSVILLNAWTTSGTFMLFYLASLQSISRDVYEAAAIDGASAWQTFWRVTFPLLKPGPLLRGHGRRHRSAPAVRPGLHRRWHERRSQQRPDDDGAVPLQGDVWHERQFQSRSGSRRDPVCRHPQRHASPKTALRPGTELVRTVR